jgi:hypothetical protein
MNLVNNLKEVIVEKKPTKSGRRQILARALKDTRELMGIDVKALAAIQERVHKEYDEILPQIAKEQTAIAEKRADRNVKALEQRFSAVKRQSAEKSIIGTGDLGTIYPPMLRCWCNFLEDFINPNECGGDLTEEGADAPNQFVAESGHATAGENKHKPFVTTRGAGDADTDIVTQESWFKFIIDDDKFESAGNYCITPTVLLSGYWIKENWGGGCGVTLESSGEIDIKLSVTASQLVGPPLGEKEVEVFNWQSGDSYTGAIDKIYNVSGNSASIPLSLIVNVDPSKGDVLVKVTLTIRTSMTGNGRYLVDMKNSDAFYFWVERVELAKRICRPYYCFPGVPEPPSCPIGGPDKYICRISGPTPPDCIIGGPDNFIDPICTFMGGPKVPGGAGCILGGPDPAPCTAGPPLDVIIDPGQWVEGQVTVDLARVPKSMRRSLSKMLQQIRKS